MANSICEIFVVADFDLIKNIPTDFWLWTERNIIDLKGHSIGNSKSDYFLELFLIFYEIIKRVY